MFLPDGGQLRLPLFFERILYSSIFGCDKFRRIRAAARCLASEPVAAQA
jgi:hypothetical protein